MRRVVVGDDTGNVGGSSPTWTYTLWQNGYTTGLADALAQTDTLLMYSSPSSTSVISAAVPWMSRNGCHPVIAASDPSRYVTLPHESLHRRWNPPPT